MTGMIRSIVTATAVAATILLAPSSAGAVKIMPGAEKLDYCRDVRGFQSVYDVTGAHPRWLIDFSTRRDWDCVRNAGNERLR